jgi:hypothetical protein
MIYLNELYFSYDVFSTVINMQYTCDSLRHGPNLDNISFSFEFMQTNFENYESGSEAILPN